MASYCRECSGECRIRLFGKEANSGVILTAPASLSAKELIDRVVYRLFCGMSEPVKP